MTLFSSLEIEFIQSFLLSLALGFIIGLERSLKSKPAGINTQIFVITASMLYTFISRNVPSPDPTRIAAQIVTGIGFLGAGIIMKKSFTGKLANVTTAADIWLTAAIGMAIGFQMYMIAIIATIGGVLASRVPDFNKFPPFKQ